MIQTFICISDMATKIVGGLFGLLLAIVIAVIFIVKKKKSD